MIEVRLIAILNQQVERRFFQVTLGLMVGQTFQDLFVELDVLGLFFNCVLLNLEELVTHGFFSRQTFSGVLLQQKHEEIA